MSITENEFTILSSEVKKFFFYLVIFLIAKRLGKDLKTLTNSKIIEEIRSVKTNLRISFIFLEFYLKGK